MIRQGEILLIPVNRPENMETKPTRAAVLGTGETGNAHVLTGDVKWLFDAAEDIARIEREGALAAVKALFVEVEAPAVIEHSDRSDQGHAPVIVPAGVYRVAIKREYDPFADAPRYVMD